MGIWRVLSGTVHCDNCEMLIATIEFDAADEPNIERVSVWCLNCRKPESEQGVINPKQEKPSHESHPDQNT